MVNSNSGKIKNIINELNKEEINTWFDLGLFIDRFKERRFEAAFQGEAKEFGAYLQDGGLALIRFC